MQASGLKSPANEPTGAVFGFVNMLNTLLEKEQPSMIAVAFDRSEPTFRHEKYSEYKANRDAFPEELIPQLSRIKEFLRLIAIPQVEMPRYEADDIIGTLAKAASAKNIDVACLTSDKDFYQLVDDNIRLYKPGKPITEFDIVGKEAVFQKFGVEPHQVIDVLAIIGDTSDNVPGVKGVGDKTAIPLVQKYGSLENIYAHLNEIESKSVRAKFEANRDIAFLSKELVTIITNAPLDFSLEHCHRSTPDIEGIGKLFGELGLVQVRKRLIETLLKYQQSILPEISSEVQEKSKEIDLIEDETKGTELTDINSYQKKYIFVDSVVKFNSMLDELSKAELISFDLETSALDKMTCEIVGIALSCKPDKAYYVPVKEDSLTVKQPQTFFKDGQSQGFLFGSGTNKIEEPIISPDNISFNVHWALEHLKPVLENPAIGKCGQNCKFDYSILLRHGVDSSPIVFDTMIASYLLDTDLAHNLDALSKKWLNYEPIPISSLIGEKKSNQISMRQLEPEKISDYACEDADLTLKLTLILKEELKKENLLKLAQEIEFPLIEPLSRMELAGVAINTATLAEISKKIIIESENLQKGIFNEAGSLFNIDSPKQLAHILFEKLMIPPVKKSKTGYSTDVDVLSELAPAYPIAGLVLEYRQLQKLKTTYVDTLPKLINPITGRIHTTFNQTIASTGRLTSTDPNLQNIPIRSELGKEIRRAFSAQHKNAVMMSADYSQIELRIMAHLSGDKNLIDAFKNNLDIHAATAAGLFDVPLDFVTSDQRRVAKTVNFGIMYGLGSFGLSQRLGIPRKEASSIIDNYFRKYSGIKKYMTDTIESTRTKGFAETICGRRRYFPDLLSANHNLRTAAERAAINMPIQGTASDLMKIAMIAIDRRMRKENIKSMMILQVHDELVFETYLDEADELEELVKYEMENALRLGFVPVVAEVGIGATWFDAH